MKLIDKQGRFLGKINILDLCAIIILISLVVFSGYKVLKGTMTNITVKEETVNVEFSLLVEEEKGYLDVIKVGDQMSQTKAYLDAYVKSVEISPIYRTNLDSDNNPVVSEDPLLEQALVTITATVPYKSMSYNYGNQELRQGKTIFLESNLYKFKGQIESLKVVD